MKTILTALREQGKEGQTIGEALGGYLIGEAIAGESDSASSSNGSGSDSESGKANGQE